MDRWGGEVSYTPIVCVAGVETFVGFFLDSNGTNNENQGVDFLAKMWSSIVTLSHCCTALLRGAVAGPDEYRRAPGMRRGYLYRFAGCIHRPSDQPARSDSRRYGHGAGGLASASGAELHTDARWVGIFLCQPDPWHRVADHRLRAVLPVTRRQYGRIFHLPAFVSRRDGRHCFERQHIAFTRLLGANVSLILLADRLLETPSRRTSGRTDGAGGHRYGRACHDRGYAAARADRRQL